MRKLLFLLLLVYGISLNAPMRTQAASVTEILGQARVDDRVYVLRGSHENGVTHIVFEQPSERAGGNSDDLALRFQGNAVYAPSQTPDTWVKQSEAQVFARMTLLGVWDTFVALEMLFGQRDYDSYLQKGDDGHLRATFTPDDYVAILGSRLENLTNSVRATIARVITALDAHSEYVLYTDGGRNPSNPSNPSIVRVEIKTTTAPTHPQQGTARRTTETVLLLQHE